MEIAIQNFNNPDNLKDFVDIDDEEYESVRQIALEDAKIVKKELREDNRVVFEDGRVEAGMLRFVLLS